MSKAEQIEVTQENPAVANSAYKVNYYHTTRCQFIRNAKYPEKVKNISHHDIEWHGLEKCDDCKRKETEGEWKSLKYRKIEKIAWDVGVSCVDDYDRKSLIEELNERGVDPNEY